VGILELISAREDMLTSSSRCLRRLQATAMKDHVYSLIKVYACTLCSAWKCLHNDPHGNEHHETSYNEVYRSSIGK
jgi:hypothetical protein